MEIDNKNVDREEERRSDRKRQDQRNQQEKQMQKQGMKTFEAKLSEKTASEITQKETAKQNWHDSKKSKQDKQNLLEKIIGVAKEKTEDDGKTRVKSVMKHEEEKKEDTKDDAKQADAKHDQKTELKSDAPEKKGEVAEDGHKRVAEKEEQDGGSGSSGGGSAGADTESGKQSSTFGYGAGSEDSEKNYDEVAMSQEKVNPVSKMGESGGGFDADARGFEEKDLDEIVAHVELSLNEDGEESFTVELSDAYFDGLTIQTTRTDEGVVLRFICPNISVRSTFLKQRPKVYKHLMSVEIDVCRIEIV